MIGKLLDNILGWHKPTKIKQAGINNKSICKYCGKEILQDSNGDWF